MSTVIHVGARPPEFHCFADYFDGESALVRRCGVVVRETPDGPVLEISPPEAEPVFWPMRDLRAVPDQAGDDCLVLAIDGDPVARLHLHDNEARRIVRARAVNLHRRPRTISRARLVAWAAAAVGAVALIIFVLVPVLADRLAEYLPPAGEKALGDATFEQIRAALADDAAGTVGACERPAGLAALDELESRLIAGADLPYGMTTHVLDNDLVNAFALPGGHIVLFRGLIDEAQSAEELGAVIAHEIGHVVRRDPTRGALRSAGSIGVLGLLFGDFAGGTAVLFLAERLIEATYSQEAEAAADAFAHRALAAAGAPPSALATLFERMRAEQGEAGSLVAHFMAHPRMGDRIAAARAADSLVVERRPLLDAAAWAAIKSVCR